MRITPLLYMVNAGWNIHPWLIGKYRNIGDKRVVASFKPYLESEISEPEYCGDNGEDSVDGLRRDLDDLEGQPEGVELVGIVDAVQGRAAGLVQVAVLGGFGQHVPVAQILITLKRKEKKEYSR